jgi:hypothetical protein
MLKRRFVGVAAIFAAAMLVIASFAHYAEAQKPGSSVIELCAPISASANVTGVAPVPLGTQIRVGARLIGVLKIAGMSGTFDCYFQHSCDDGQTWSDFAHVNTTTANTYYIPVSTIAAGSTTVSPISDGTLGNGVVTQGPVGDRLRIKYSVTGIGATPVNFQAFVLPD